MKRAIHSVVIGIGQKRRLRARSKQADATVSRAEDLQRYGTASSAPTFAGGGVPAEALASLAAVTRAASESAVAGAPSAIPAIPSVPAFGVAQRRDPLDRLQELAALRDRGALTPAEFESQKAQILAEI
jgi:hypothetical protein